MNAAGLRRVLGDGKWRVSAAGRWSLSLGFRGCRVRVFQRMPGSTFARETWMPGRGRDQRSLGTSSRTEARELAERFLLALVQGSAHQPRPALTLASLWRAYSADAPRRSLATDRYRRQQASAALLLHDILGAEKRVAELTLQDAERFTARRRLGWTDRNGRVRRPAGPRSIAFELGTLRTMIIWATQTRDRDGSWLLAENPLRGLRLPTEEAPRRPVATRERFERTREALQHLARTARRAAGRWVRLECALVLAEATGRRIGAIGGLRWSDLRLDRPDPEIRWRREFDKRRREAVIPIPDALAIQLKEFRAQLNDDADGWVFPRRNQNAPWPREAFAQGLRRAEEHAGLEHAPGGLWHPYRRKWRTERAHLPEAALMAAAGWSDRAVMDRSYNVPRREQILDVLRAPQQSSGRAHSGEPEQPVRGGRPEGASALVEARRSPDSQTCSP